MKKLNLLFLSLVIAFAGCNPFDEYNQVASNNFHTACLNVSREAKEKSLTIYAFKELESYSTVFADHSITVLYNKDIADTHKKFSGTYTNHHNSVIFSYACFLYPTNKEVFEAVIEILSKAQPDFTYSSPTHGNRSLNWIIETYKKNPGDLKFLIDDEQKQWSWRKEYYNLDGARTNASE